MKKLFFFSLAVLLSLTSCSLDDSLTPIDQQNDQNVTIDGLTPETANASETGCDEVVIYYKEEGHPCGFRLFWEERDMYFVPKSTELFSASIKDGSFLTIAVDIETMEPEFCENLTGIAVTCVGLNFEVAEPVVKPSDLVD